MRGRDARAGRAVRGAPRAEAPGLDGGAERADASADAGAREGRALATVDGERVKIRGIRTLAGPNVFHHEPVVVLTLELEELAERHSGTIPGLTERLVALLPGLEAHTCSPGYPGGFVERLREGTWPGHIIEHVTLELSQAAGIEQRFGKTVRADGPDSYDVAVRFTSEAG